jgi:adenylate cyclase
MAETVKRKLAAILIADVVGYSRLMGEDEIGTLDALRILRSELIEPTIAAHGGRIVKLMGDGILAEFPSAVEAVRCSIEIQQAIPLSNAKVPEERHTVLRMGINLGDVVVEDGDIYGDGVNVAARLEGMADPGGVLISQTVWESVGKRLGVDFFDNGERKFKNIDRPIRVWSWPRKLSVARADRKPSVFVVDFEGRVGEERRCADDLGAELRAHLARLTGLQITDEQRAADYIVKGSVHMAKGRSRVFAVLIAAEGARQIWSERYDENTDDPFDIVDRCIPRISMSVRRRIAAEDAHRLADRNLDELSLEELLSAAGVSFFTPTMSGWKGGGQIAEQALKLAPQNFMALAMAAAGLGLAEYLYGFRKTEHAVTSLAFSRVDKALRLNNESDMLHAVHSLLLLHVRRRHREATAAGHRALELNSDYNMGFWVLGAAQAFGGDYDRGVENATYAVNLDIRDPYVHLYSRAAAYGHAGAERYNEATDWFRRADQLAPGLPPNLIGLTVTQWLEGDETGAREALDHLLLEEPEFRLGELEPLPYRNNEVWGRFAEALRVAGAPT